MLLLRNKMPPNLGIIVDFNYGREQSKWMQLQPSPCPYNFTFIQLSVYTTQLNSQGFNTVYGGNSHA